LCENKEIRQLCFISRVVVLEVLSETQVEVSVKWRLLMKRNISEDW
jgi:hypothetical protein